VRSASLISLALVVAGCGGGNKGSDEDQVRSAVTGYAHAFGNGDGEKACSKLTKGAQAAFVTRVSALVGTRNCAEAIDKLHAAAGATVTAPFRDAKVTAVTVKGDAATATLTAGSGTRTVPLQKQDGDWKIARVPGT
jgi:predicted NodU family carbamoyl transferase